MVKVKELPLKQWTYKAIHMYTKTLNMPIRTVDLIRYKWKNQLSRTIDKEARERSEKSIEMSCRTTRKQQEQQLHKEHQAMNCIAIISYRGCLEANIIFATKY